MPICAAWLIRSENATTPANSLWRAEISQRSGAARPEVCSCLGAAVDTLMRPATSHVTLQPTIALREEARQAAETALTLQPNLGEAAACQRLLSLRLSEGLRHRCALL